MRPDSRVENDGKMRMVIVEAIGAKRSVVMDDGASLIVLPHQEMLSRIAPLGERRNTITVRKWMHAVAKPLDSSFLTEVGAWPLALRLRACERIG